MSPPRVEMLDSTFAAAYIDNGRRHRILGRRLRPLCLWHLLLLQTIDSPFITGGSISLLDLKTAIGICGLRYRNSDIKRPWFPRFTTITRLKKNVDLFIEYIGDYSSKPEYNVVPFDLKMPSGPPPAPLTPPPHIIATAYNVAQGARVSIREAWDMPIGEAYISEAMYFRIQGAQLDFLSDEERKFQEQLKAAGVK
jgi:hypothetical protein